LLSDWELWACANHYISRHREDAAVIAAMRCDELFARGEYEGAPTYRAIVNRINQLLETPPDEPLN
jgi:hypothetical protein